MDFNQNYFEIFGLPVEYRVDMDTLADRFLELQKQVHPDKFVSATDQEQRLSMQWATLVNSANETLKSPLKRALYMLEIREVEVAHNPTLAPSFLMQQIELREQLESIENNDAGLKQVEDFKNEVRAVINGIEEQFAASIVADPQQAEQIVYEFQFMNKLLSEANDLEERMLDY